MVEINAAVEDPDPHAFARGSRVGLLIGINQRHVPLALSQWLRARWFVDAAVHVRADLLLG
jgi:hypothetical protein